MCNRKNGARAFSGRAESTNKQLNLPRQDCCYECHSHKTGQPSKTTSSSVVLLLDNNSDKLGALAMLALGIFFNGHFTFPPPQLSSRVTQNAPIEAELQTRKTPQ